MLLGDDMFKNIFCVDIGGSKLMCGAINSGGVILESVEWQYPEGYSVDTVIKLITKGYEKLKGHELGICAAAIPGLCDYKKGQWLYSPFSKIENIPITQIIEDATGLKTYADNDVNLSALAERHFGICKSKNDFLWVTVSNGIGGGLFLDGKLYRGQNLSAGEIGHFIVEESGRECGCGNIGCLEAMASGASISNIYTEKTGTKLSAKEISRLAENGDEAALEVWQSAGYYIGKAASYAVNLLGIDTVVLGGGAAESFDILKSSADKALDRYLFKKANPEAKVVHSSLGRHAALLGCAALALENNIQGVRL